MTTVTLQAGNSDDKLGQRAWSRFCDELALVVEHFAEHVHFAGHSAGGKPWQNACWVLELQEPRIAEFVALLTKLRTSFQQDSLAFTIGRTEFI